MAEDKKVGIGAGIITLIVLLLLAMRLKKEPTKYTIGVVFSDWTTYENVPGTLIIDGIEYPVERKGVEEVATVTAGIHTFDAIIPSGYVFRNWEVYPQIAPGHWGFGTEGAELPFDWDVESNIHIVVAIVS